MKLFTVSLPEEYKQLMVLKSVRRYLRRVNSVVRYNARIRSMTGLQGVIVPHKLFKRGLAMVPWECVARSVYGWK